MEFLLLWWDELDDILGACRHLASITVEEVSAIAVPLTAAVSGIGAGLLVLIAPAKLAATVCLLQRVL